MSEPHTADLGTRYRYREEGRKFEVERRGAWLNRVRTWYPEKANIWCEGYEMAVNDIIKLIEEHALDYAEITCDFNGHGVSFDEQGLIALIKGENK